MYLPRQHKWRHMRSRICLHFKISKITLVGLVFIVFYVILYVLWWVSIAIISRVLQYQFKSILFCRANLEVKQVYRRVCWDSYNWFLYTSVQHKLFGKKDLPITWFSRKVTHTTRANWICKKKSYHNETTDKDLIKMKKNISVKFVTRVINGIVILLLIKQERLQPLPQ